MSHDREFDATVIVEKHKNQLEYKIKIGYTITALIGLLTFIAHYFLVSHNNTINTIKADISTADFASGERRKDSIKDFAVVNQRIDLLQERISDNRELSNETRVIVHGITSRLDRIDSRAERTEEKLSAIAIDVAKIAERVTTK